MELAAENSVIDISDNTITINGANVCIPCHINELKKLLGKPWEEVMRGGEDIEIARRKNIGAYSLVSVYANAKKGNADIICEAYTGLEIHLQSSETAEITEEQ